MHHASLHTTGRRAAHRWPAVVTGLLLLAAPATAQDELELIGGDRLSGTIVEQTDEAIVLDHAALGRITIPREQLAGALAADAEDAAVEAAAPPPLPSDWISRFVLNGGASAGNSDTQNINVAVTSVRETEETITNLDASYYYGASNGDRDTNRLTTGIRNDWLLPDSRWFYFADGRFDLDEFQSWDYRVSGHLGIGYELINEEDLRLNLRTGAGAFKEFGSMNDDVQFEALIGLDVDWTINETQSLKADTTLYPSLSDTGEYRWVSNAGWFVLLDEEANMNFNVSLRHEYQSEVDPGRKHGDLYVTAGLAFDF